MSEYVNRWSRENYKKRVSAGLCAHCGKPNDTTTVWCLDCTNKKSLASKQKRNDCIVKGICTRCQKQPSLSGVQYCQSCKEKGDTRRKLRASRLKEKNVCLHCGGEKQRPTHSLCNSCDERKANNYLNRRKSYKEQGLCATCGADRLSGQDKCLTHYLHHMSQRHLGSTKFWKELLDKFNSQNGKCFYTRLPLTIGSGASIDHRIPKSRGGKDELSNLVWCDYRVNMMKTDLLHSELISLCKSVVDTERNKEVSDLNKLFNADVN